jgi:hypothetical protein
MGMIILMGKMIRFVLFFLIVVMPYNLFGQSILLTSYERATNADFFAVYLKLVDLQTKIVQDSLLLSDEGTIYTPIPIKFTLRNTNYYLTIVSEGEYDKNTSVGQCKVFWWITNITNHINVVRYDSLLDASISTVENYLDEPYFGFGVRNELNRRRLLEDGKYDLDSNFAFHKIGSINNNVGPNGLSSIGSFSQFERLNNSGSNNLYSAFGADGKYWILRVNSTDNSIADSLRLFSEYPMSKLFAYHPTRNLLYCFFINYVNHSIYPDLNRDFGQNWGHPQVFIFDPNTFTEIGHYLISDFSEENYPGMEFNRAQVVGDYLVYYFLKSEGLAEYDPAMLFIFDTRTNEASWLRVGWR